MRELHTWHKAVELVQMVDFIIYPRPGVRPPAYIDLADFFGDRNATRLVHGILPDTIELSELSSSEIRAAIRAGEDVSDRVPSGVLEYIREHRLYS